MAKKLLGSGSPARNPSSPKGIWGTSLLEQNLSPHLRGDAQAVQDHLQTYRQPFDLHKAMQASRSTGLKP